MILLVVGTRPEAIKMAPVYHALTERRLDVRVAVSGQHVELLQDVVTCLDLPIHWNLGVMRHGQSLDDLLADVVRAVGALLEREKPTLTIVHGDTATSMGAALASYLRQVPVAHVEAGLRSGNLASPWPEEGSRRVVDAVSSIHLAPTQEAMSILAAEGHARTSSLTGNTVVDAVMRVRETIEAHPNWRPQGYRRFGLDQSRPTILATLHRREGLTGGIAHVLAGLRVLAREGYQVVIPVHRNPAVSNQIQRELQRVSNATLLPPLSYTEFTQLLLLSDLVITDSGGVQEEAPVLEKYCLITREETERPEGAAAGVAELVGFDTDHLVERARVLLRQGPRKFTEEQMFVYGDGQASTRISSLLASWSEGLAG